MNPLPRIILLILLMSSPRLSAMPMDFTFDLDFLIDTFDSQVTVTLDGYTGTGLEVFTGYDGNFVAFNVKIAGVTFTIDDEIDAIVGPMVALQDGSLYQINYSTGIAIPFGDELYINYAAAVANDVRHYRDQTGPNLIFAGEVVPTSWRMAPVPIPAAAWLFGSALLGLGVIKRRKA